MIYYAKMSGPRLPTPLTIVALTDPLIGSGSTSVVTTAAQSFTISNGVGPYTYNTTIVTSGGIVVLNGTTSGPSFQKSGAAPLTNYTGTGTTVVTDTGAGSATAGVSYAVECDRS